MNKLQVTVGWEYSGLVPNLQLQDEIVKHYAVVCAVNGLANYDFDGQEFLFHNGHGYYSTKRFSKSSGPGKMPDRPMPSQKTSKRNW